MSNAPKHYKGDGTVTCADAMASMMSRAEDEHMLAATEFYWWGCAFKYVWRWPYKNGAEDIEKAIDCLQKLLGEERDGEPRESAQFAEPSFPCEECVYMADGSPRVCRSDGRWLFCSDTRGSRWCLENSEKEGR